MKFSKSMFVGAVNGKVCSFVIDSRCEENLVSLQMVESLGLDMDWYPASGSD